MKYNLLVLVVALVLPSARGTAQPYKCALGKTVRITGTMNIRAAPNTSKPPVGTLQAGEEISVRYSTQTGGYCWLQFMQNRVRRWVAKTNNMTYVDAAPAPDLPDLPTIRGNAFQKAKIQSAFALLQSKSQQWYDYATEVIERIDIIPNLKLKDRSVVAIAHYPANRISFDRRFSQKTNVDELASTIVHEACHLHQGKRDRGRGSYTSETAHERECYALEARVLLTLNRNKRDIVKKLRCLGREYNQFFDTDWIIKFVCGIGLWD